MIRAKSKSVAKSRVSLNPDRNLARAKLRQVLTFYNIADHYSDMLRGMGFEKEVDAIHEAFQKGGFKAAMAALTDDYMDKLPVVPATNIKEIKEKMKAFEEAGVTRMVIPYVPVTEPVVEDARKFFEAWGNCVKPVSRSCSRFKVQGSNRQPIREIRTLNMNLELLN